MVRRQPTATRARAGAWWVPLSVLLAACAAGSGDGSATTGGDSPRPTVATGPCGDDQAGRYVDESFQVQPIRSVSFADGLEADIYSPADDPATCRAAIVWVHGGGFTEGTRDGAAEGAWGEALASRGYTLMSIDYHLGGGEQFGVDGADDPERAAVVATAIADAQGAVRWLRESAGGLGVDPARVAIGGTSAGAMTALGAALTAPTEAERVCTAVSVSGAIRSEWVGSDATSALFVHGGADESVPFESAVAAVAAINAAGASAELVPIEGAGHEITGVPPSDVVAAVVDWLLAHAAVSCG